MITALDMRNACHRAPLALEYEHEEAFANFWDGLFGIFPGTASSNNSLEARHSDWQAELQSLGGKAGVHDALLRLQSLYERWRDADGWLEESALSPEPDDLDPNLLHGPLLPRVDRVPAVGIAAVGGSPSQVFRIFEVSPSCTIVAMERAPCGNLDEDVASQGVAALQLTGVALVTKLENLGILLRNALDEGVAARLDGLRLPKLRAGSQGSLRGESHVLLPSISAYKRVFRDIVYVFTVGSRGKALQRCCTCGPCLRYHTCEHMVFVESLTLPNAEATRDFSNLPANRPRGRPRGSVVPRGVRHATERLRK